MKRSPIILICLLVGGCATVSSVEKDMQLINYNDGISEKEALTIARKSIINSKLDDYYKIGTASVFNEGEYYRVWVPSFSLNDQVCVIIIEKEKGEMLAFWQAYNTEESFDGKFPNRRSIEEWRELKKFWP